MPRFSVKQVFSFCCLLITSQPVLASNIEISKVRAPEAAPVARVMAAYLDIQNHGNQDRYITGVRSAQFEKVEIHRMSHINGMMHMEKQDQLILPAGKTVSLQPGGFHMMLFRPGKWYQAGDNFRLTITLDNQKQIEINVPVTSGEGENPHVH